jgi:UV DNA damage endonuclease
MIVRLGYVAMSTLVKNASPSKTMTVTNFSKLGDRAAAIRKLERIAAENLHNTLRLLRHNRAYEIQLYRLSSKLVPLIGHEMLEDWDPIPKLAAEFLELGSYAKRSGMRISFHPEHFTVLSTPRQDVLDKSIADLERHAAMLGAMGFGPEAKCNIHIGGSYGDKAKAGERFVRNFQRLRPDIQARITLENDDKTFTALETLVIAERVGIPMVLDLHHHQVNHQGEEIGQLWPRIRTTWRRDVALEAVDNEAAELPPKIHVSSPKSESDPRSHADYVEAKPILAFLRSIRADTPFLDVMLEAKMKDQALLRLIDDCKRQHDVTSLTQAAFKI